MIQRRRWYAVRCDSARHVIKAGVALTRLGINVFIPMHYREERQGDWMVAVENGLLFPPYLFIAMQAKSSLWAAVNDVDGVDHVLGGRNRNGEFVHLPIPYREMRKIRTKHKAGERMREVDRFKPGQKIRIAGGPFEGFEGIFQKPEKGRVRILVSIFGRNTEAELLESDIKAA